MICMSSSSWASVIHSHSVLNLYLCFKNCSTILTSCPLLSFLARRTSTWSPLTCIFITFLVCFGPFLNSLSLCFDQMSAMVSLMNLSCNIIVCIATGLFLINTLWTLYKSIQWEQVTDPPHSCLSLYINPINTPSLIIAHANDVERYLIT